MPKKSKIAITIRSFDLASIAKNKEFVSVVYMNKTGRHLEGKELVEAARDASGIIAGTEKFTRETLSGLPGLKVISRIGVGMDNIDLEAAKEFGISICNTPQAPVNAVAEHAVALLLCVLKKIHEYNNNIRSGVFKPLPGGRLLEGKRVGIVGYGRIGKRFSSLVSAFGADVLWYDPYTDSGDANRVETLGELLQNSDIISLHASLDRIKRPIIGKGELQKCRKGVIVINTARGKLIDEDALTPHISSNVRETRSRMERESVNNLVKGLRGVK
jgi:D-3-phosphoglycerate dehydrogenase